MPPRSRSASSSIRTSTGRATACSTRRGTRRRSTSFTSRVSPRAIPAFARICAAPTPGSASDAAVGYLNALGISAVELLPVHHSISEEFLHSRGLENYWGYSSIGYLAPHARYAATGDQGEQVSEFKGMVKALHRAGIEVILDVVYNHTAESDHRGPTLAFRGLDNAAYYRLDGDRRRYVDFTGTGNTLDTTHPAVLRLVLDSLRYWVTECHVDGFRFDLAATLARDPHDFNRRSSFLSAIHQDPVLSQVKLIAEPWDLGSGGYQVGGFPPGWSEWNDAYRDTMRDFWRAQTNAAAFAATVHGLARPVPRCGARAVGVDELHHRARRVHPRRPRLLQRASTTRRTSRTTATAATTTARGTAAPRARPTTPR